MPRQIFTDAWLALANKDKKAALETTLLGLRPAVAYLDDEPEALEVFELKCQEFGLESIVSSDPEELLQQIRKNKSRIIMIVSDYTMPQESGFEFRAKVSAISLDIPFFILSGHVSKDLALQGMKHKISGFLGKPLNRDQFVNLLVKDCEERALVIKEEYEMLKGFTDDVTNIISEVEEGCLRLEADPHDRDTVARIFGLIHTVKGSSGFFEPRTLHLFGHAFEEILKEVQNGSRQVTTPLISTWLKACDVLRMLNGEFITGIHLDHDVEQLKKVLDVSQAGPIEKTISQNGSTPAPAAEKRQEAQKTSDIKVSMTVLEEFTQVSGELTVIRNMINKVVGAIEKQYPTDKEVLVLSELLEEMHKINSDMQTKITDIRRIPASQLVKPLQRNFRDTSKALNKEVDFVIEGDDLRLDNAIADTLSRTLVHLMRNSLDHGLEANAERKDLGKPYRGQLLLKFECLNENIVVTLADDGRGINTDKIRQKVISQGLRSAEAAEKMSDEELHLMIFESGFSTATQVTEFSGRGVGMSMVKESIEEQKGKIRIHSEKGKGSKFILEIPIPKSVLITNVLFVASGSMIFGLPQENVLRVLDKTSLQGNGVEGLEGSRFIRFDGHLIPVISLGQTLSLEVSVENFLVVLDQNGQKFAVEVSRVLDTEDAVIKPFAFQVLKAPEVYKGGTFLGDGTVGLVIDVPGLARKISLKVEAPKKQPPREQKRGEKLENVISFSLATPGRYAIPEKDVFRVEVLPAGDFCKSGGFYVMPYRNTLLTLIDVDEHVFKSKAVDRDPLPVLIIERTIDSGKQYIGLIVKEIKDLEPVEMKIVPPLRKRRGVLGNLVIPEGSMTLLDTAELLGIVMNADEERSASDIAA